jgi:MFS family permease
MDNAGALFGPLVAYALVGWLALSHRNVFALSAIPAALTMLTLIFGVKEEAVSPAPPPKVDGHAVLHRGAVPVPARLRAYYAVLFLFYLGNSTDFFLLMRAQDAGVGAAYMPLLWALLNGVRSAFGAWLGALSDRVGRKRLIVIGWTVYAAVYVAFGWVREAWQVWALFAIYGLHSAATDGPERALVADLAPTEIRGRAFGLYNFITGIAALPASIGFGLIWQHVGHAAAFHVGAGLAIAAVIGVLVI